jgi:FKBP-type peptidyl-prolyl cis-trans isomerase
MFRHLGTTFIAAMVLTASVSCAQDPQEGQQGLAEIPGLKPSASVTTVEDGKSLLQKASYIIGFNTTKSLLGDLGDQGVDVDVDKLMEGMQGAIAGQEIGMTQEEIRTVMMAFQKIVQKQQIEKMTKLSAENIAEGKAYLAENAKKEGVKTLEGGVQYEVIEEGSGESPVGSDKVRIHYHGTLPNGTVFDSSINPSNGGPPQPIELGVDQFVSGFSTALKAMKKGSRWKVVIPSDLAYGKRAKGMIGPDQTLLFELQLIEILK